MFIKCQNNKERTGQVKENGGSYWREEYENIAH